MDTHYRYIFTGFFKGPPIIYIIMQSLWFTTIDKTLLGTSGADLGKGPRGTGSPSLAWQKRNWMKEEQEETRKE